MTAASDELPSIAVGRIDRFAVSPTCAVSFSRPWRAMPLRERRLALAGQLRSDAPIRCLVLSHGSVDVANIAPVERDSAAQVEIHDGASFVYGFDVDVELPDPVPRSVARLRAVGTSGDAIAIADFHLDVLQRTRGENARLVPDFLVIGAMKAGTTSIYDSLCHHPRVVDRQPKEIHFFDEHWHRGLDYYRSCFVDKLDYPAHVGMLAGDATPGYLSPFHPECAARAYAFAPEARIVVSLRDPTERAISHYHHKRATLGQSIAPIEEEFSAQALSDPASGADCLAYGRYSTCLAPWLAAFPRERILFLRFDDLAIDPEGVATQLCSFLGLGSSRLITIRRVFANDYPPAPGEVVRRLDDYYARERADLVALLGGRFDFGARR